MEVFVLFVRFLWTWRLTCPEARFGLFVHLPHPLVGDGKHAESVGVVLQDGVHLGHGVWFCVLGSLAGSCVSLGWAEVCARVCLVVRILNRQAGNLVAPHLRVCTRPTHTHTRDIQAMESQERS